MMTDPTSLAIKNEIVSPIEVCSLSVSAGEGVIGHGLDDVNQVVDFLSCHHQLNNII